MSDITLIIPNRRKPPIVATYINGRNMETYRNNRLHMMNLVVDLKENNISLEELMVTCSNCSGDLGLIIKKDYWYFNHDNIIVMNRPTLSISISPDDRNKVGVYISSNVTYGPDIDSGSIIIGNKKFPSLTVSRNIYMTHDNLNEINIIIPASETNMNEITDLFSENNEILCEGIFYNDEKIKFDRVLEIKYTNSYEISEFNESDVFPMDTISITLLSN